MTLTDLFDLSLVGRRDKTALEFQGREYTFGEIDRGSNRVAYELLRRGLKKGDRLCVYLPNSVEMIHIFIACTKTGVIFVPINILYRDREISHILADANPSALITDTEIESPAPIWRTADLDQTERNGKKSNGNTSTARPAAQLDGDSPAAIIYTSGTTGESKGALLTHNNFAANAVNLLACWQITADDRFLLCLPLFHVHALANGLHCWLISGCRIRLLERFEHQKAAAELLHFRPTLFFGVPTMYIRLLDLSTQDAAQIGRTMRLFVSGSAPLPAQVLEEFQVKFGHTILERYGMTETLMNMSNPYAGERRPGSVGFPLPGVSVRLLNSELQDVADGEAGELYLKGPNVFPGYWNRPQATADALVDGYFKTGDLATRAPDGYYTLCGRKSDLIISGGFNIYPREIEEFLQQLDGVAEAAVVGVADRIRGEVPVAYLVPNGKMDVAILQQQCRANLASFKIPRAFIPVEQLPRNALGKIQKHLLPKITISQPT